MQKILNNNPKKLTRIRTARSKRNPVKRARHKSLLLAIPSGRG
jgi:hypothetical protein